MTNWNGPGKIRKYGLHRLLLLTLDPVHIGSGGLQLGRVDLSIAREPGTKLPKIPGTSLSGAARAYAALQIGSTRCAGQGLGDPQDDTALETSADAAPTDDQAGKKDQAKGHCGKQSCPVCYTFGSLRSEVKSDQAAGNGRAPTAQDRTQRAMAGTVNLFDAHILFFPVASTQGPVWVTTENRLNESGFEVTGGATTDGEAAITLTGNDAGHLNLGWLLLSAKAGATVTLPANVTLPDQPIDHWAVLKDRIAVVTDRIFSQVVRSNLEVRTSVSIDPFTGAAKTGALFSYESIPRATWLVSDIVEDDYRGKFPENQTTLDGKPLSSPFDVAHRGLELAELLGVGGMGTRGFGRLKVVQHWTAPPEVTQ